MKRNVLSPFTQLWDCTSTQFILQTITVLCSKWWTHNFNTKSSHVCTSQSRREWDSGPMMIQESLSHILNLNFSEWCHIPEDSDQCVQQWSCGNSDRIHLCSLTVESHHLSQFNLHPLVSTFLKLLKSSTSFPLWSVVRMLPKGLSYQFPHCQSAIPKPPMYTLSVSYK